MSFAALKVQSLLPRYTSINHALSGGLRMSVQHFSQQKFTVALMDRSNVVASRSIKVAQADWLTFNPYYLMRLGAQGKNKAQVQKMWRQVDAEGANPTTAVDNLSRLALLTDKQDVSYYAVYLLAKKVKEGKVDRQQGIRALMACTISAFAEDDAPRIAFINGYLFQLGSILGPTSMQEIEEAYPGMTTENLVGSFDHIIKF